MLRLTDMRTRRYVAALVLLGACGSPAKTTVTGLLRMTGGPSGASQPGVPGHVFFESGGKRTTATAAADGSFTVSVPAGRYEVTGSSPQYGSEQGICRADAPVAVRGSTVHGVVVACSRK